MLNDLFKCSFLLGTVCFMFQSAWSQKFWNRSIEMERFFFLAERAKLGKLVLA